VTEVAGRPACVNYNCCGARDEGDEATLKGKLSTKGAARVGGSVEYERTLSRAWCWLEVCVNWWFQAWMRIGAASLLGPSSLRSVLAPQLSFDRLPPDISMP
jgi:hypothetical protein